MSMEHDSVGMRMWEGLRERSARSNPWCYRIQEWECEGGDIHENVSHQR